MLFTINLRILSLWVFKKTFSTINFIGYRPSHRMSTLNRFHSTDRSRPKLETFNLKNHFPNRLFQVVSYSDNVILPIPRNPRKEVLILYIFNPTIE